LASDPQLQQQKTSSTGDREKECGGGWFTKSKVRIVDNKLHDRTGELPARVISEPDKLVVVIVNFIVHGKFTLTGAAPEDGSVTIKRIIL
jgi:hypothetical protein